MSIAFGTRRAEWVKLADVPPPLAAEDLEAILRQGNPVTWPLPPEQVGDG